MVARKEPDDLGPRLYFDQRRTNRNRAMHTVMLPEAERSKRFPPSCSMFSDVFPSRRVKKSRKISNDQPDDFATFRTSSIRGLNNERDEIRRSFLPVGRCKSFGLLFCFFSYFPCFSLFFFFCFSSFLSLLKTGAC